VQIDGPAVGDTHRLLIWPGTASTPARIEDQPFDEQAMDDPSVLADFIHWGQNSFSAAHYYLAIANHGQGIQGIAWDTTTDLSGNAYLTIKELGQALSAPGIAPIDVLHLDACSMNLLEVAYEVRQRVQVLIASQYLAWDFFAYDDYQSVMDGSASPRDVARAITERYAGQAGGQHDPYTMAALDLERAEPTLTAVDALAAELATLVTNVPARDRREQPGSEGARSGTDCGVDRATAIYHREPIAERYAAAAVCERRVYQHGRRAWSIDILSAETKYPGI
jgi:hypothetical protein